MKNRPYFEDLQAFVEELQQRDELRVIKGAHWDLEIGALTEMTVEIPNPPALLFDNIKGYSKDCRILTNAMSTIRRTAIAIGFPEDANPLEMLRMWKEKRSHFAPVPPKMIEDAPVKKNVLKGKDVDIYRFPVPRWHEGDPGRYIGTADAVIMRDPDSGWVNVGTYRIMVHDKNTLGLYISPGKHGYLILQKARERKESLPIAVSFGHDPMLAIVSGTSFAQKESEYEVAGYFNSQPYKITPGVVTGVPIPANAEIVVEGEVPPPEIETRAEGPFGEWTGYYASGPAPQPIIKVKSVMFRDNPILWGMPPVKPFRVQLAALPFLAAETWDALEKSGVPEVRGVWQAQGIWYPPFTVISIKQQYAGHANQAGLVASGAKGTAYMGRFVVVVDDDIDITSLEDVIWAMTMRCDPSTDIHIIRDCWSSPLDPILSPYTRLEAPHGTQANSRLILNACKPYQWYDKFPKTCIASPELRSKVQRKFEGFFQQLLKERK